MKCDFKTLPLILYQVYNVIVSLSLFVVVYTISYQKTFGLEIQKIIERYGNEPKMGERVFPILDKSKTPEQELWVIQRYNKYIRKHMKKVAELLKLEQTPTSTWARHSFATNLNNSGFVEERAALMEEASK